jgi:hypothetical protein
MRKTIDTKEPFFEALHGAIIKEFDCSLYDITGMVRDNPAKFTAILITRHFYQFWQSAVNEAYKVNYLYVPTIVEKTMVLYGYSENYREKVQRILNFIEDYEGLESVA